MVLPVILSLLFLLAKQVGLMALVLGTITAVVVVVCELGVWFGWIEKEEEEK